MSERSGEQFDPYRVLGVPVGASKQEIRRQYRRLARRLHPDLRRDDPTAHEEMVRLNRAYQLLMDDSLRAQWELRAAEAMVGPPGRRQPVEVALGRARRFMEAGRLDEAKMACADALDADPHCAEAYLLLGQIYRREGLDHLAREMFRQAERLGKGPTGEKAAAGKPSRGAAPREIWVPEPVKVSWPVAVAGCAVAVAVLVVVVRRGSAGIVPVVAGVAASSFIAAFALAASGAIEPADAVLDEPVWGAHGRGAPLWLVMLVAGAAWAHLALIFYLVVGYLGECLRASAGIFFLAVYGIGVVASVLAPDVAGLLWLVGMNAAMVAGLVGWMVGSMFSPHEWWRSMP